MQALLDGGGWSYREVRARVVGPHGERELRRLLEPSCDAHAGLEALGVALGDEVLAEAEVVRIELGRLGPDVRVEETRTSTNERELLRAG